MSKDQGAVEPATKDDIAAHLRDRIRDGELGPGDRLPTQQKLVRQFRSNRNAVREALNVLKAEGLLAHTGRGAPPVVAEQSTHTEAPRPAGVELAERVLAAFHAEHVTIDTYSLTTETLNTALAAARLAIEAGDLNPQSITVRVIMPDPHAELALPCLVGDPTDPRPRERLRELMQTYAQVLVMDLRKLQELELVSDVSVQIRWMRMTPTMKYYRLNNSEVLHGLYKVIPRTVTHRHEDMEIYDVLGVEAWLFRYSSGSDSRDDQETAFVDTTAEWFDSLWAVAEPSDLTR
ncbi:GntR family transcriptional regulator [Streptomyces sp. 549]|uniref:GntR family transcriptional regulator n=1 Tax=Streptomyces sp. 549 TaxID=3049076 RepID=UPI0024C24A57|nr:GntR family transcriptional regulator [Streptomyces sp. 549]MDK1476192.1 GntR family transcriptional regulator [Streptomyces sp. 549]